MGLIRLAAAAGVAYGAFESNDCPLGSTRIESEAECKSAAAIIGQTWRQNESRTDRPKGCFFFNQDPWTGVYLNTHSTGSGYVFAQPLCAAGGATPLPARPRSGAVA